MSTATRGAGLEPALYRSPIALAEGRSGALSIRHKTTRKAPIVGMRQAFLRGIRPVSVELSEPLRIHELVEDGVGVWMTDAPEELEQIAQALYAMRPEGDVLVGGLGLGIMATTVAGTPGVESVTVIEKSLDVMALCLPPGFNEDGNTRLSVIRDDLKNYLRREPAPFDTYLLDTWQGTGEAAWWSEVMPLRRIIANRFGRRRVHCWAEDIMLGQIMQTLQNAPPHWYYAHLPVPMRPRVARAFVSTVGLPAWERRWGQAVDQAIEEVDRGRQ